MAVEEIGWIIFIDESFEPVESSMTWVFCVIDMTRWCMGYYQIRCSASPQRKAHPANETLHLLFSILIYPAIIPSAA